ncbi:hypothetical protein NUU61_004751 [Penicillium alfredii]|uniref:DUF6594 domain-containing protein n=1 Tax=Penicillium alfredii TaxID=1506179 RepID=A0A9W9F8D3_9EURO|nr:uncharacterized protein NUU61_004751 [Penicillium alfredii]KAJ5095395.1 hypothetical protein NUU61_004751 [Penicillium alfredii]
MPLQSQRTRKIKKDGRKRTSSTVSNSTGSAQGPVDNSKSTDKAPSPANGSKPALKPQAVSEKPEPAKPMPNVFEFLDENDDSSDDSDSDSDVSNLPHQAQALAKIQSPKPRTSPVPPGTLISGDNAPRKSPVYASSSRSSSDSRSSTSPAASSGNQLQIARKQLTTQKPSTLGSYGANQSTDISATGKRQLELSRPETHYGSSRDAASLHRPPLPPSPPSSPEDSLHRSTPTKRRSSSAAQVSSGYGFLASHLTRPIEEKDGFPPLYRRFENANHRVLLHLQDEISQMEEDLHTLDEYEEMHRIATAEQEGTKPMPASRRVDAQSQVYSSLHYRRMDLMAALTHKTEQYNNALSAYSKVLQTLPRASEKDITSYRAWMKEHNPVAAAETRFLDHDADLVSLTPRLAASAAAAPVYMAIIIASGALLLPLLAFSMISEFSGRLVVVTVVGGAAAAIAANYSAGIDTLVDSRDGWRCATIYFGFMTISAMFIP